MERVGRRGLIVMACLLAVGCQRGDDAPAGPGSPGLGWPSPFSLAPTPDGSERVWSGVLPCSDCDGVDTRLVLRVTGKKRSYLMIETYVGGERPNRFQRAGRWTENTRLMDDETLTTYTLDPGKGSQTYALRPDGALELLDVDGRPSTQAIAYRLQRL